MKLKIPFMWNLSVVGIKGIILLIVFTVVLFPSIQAQGSPLSNQTIKEAGVSETEMHLKIPSINLDAPVESVGVTSLGAMDVPLGTTNAAWFNLGPRPGEEGSSVIDGHFGLKGGAPAVFDNLNKLNKGDKIYVEDEMGETTTFVVRELRTYAKDDDTSKIFGANDNKSHLNLITCSGTWNKLEKTHSDRLVVFADKE